MGAWVNGVATRDDNASTALLKHISDSRRPLFLVDVVDAGGAAAAVRCAERAGAILDCASPPTLASLNAGGWLGTTPGEAHLRADVVLFVGTFTKEMANDAVFRRLTHGSTERKYLHLGPGSPALAMLGLMRIGYPNSPLIETIGTWRAVLKGRRFDGTGKGDERRTDVLATLASARYGVIAFPAGALRDLDVLALMGLADDLSIGTRWALLPVGIPPGQNELLRFSLALSGFPPPVDFARRVPTHDPLLAGAPSCLKRKEIDLVLWISASDHPLPGDILRVSRVTAITSHRRACSGVAVQMEAGVPGVDHSAIVEPPDLGHFVAVSPSGTDGRRTVATVLRSLTERLPPRRTPHP